MAYWTNYLAIGLGLLMMGCSPDNAARNVSTSDASTSDASTSDASASNTSTSQEPPAVATSPPPPQGQVLPVGATVTIADQVIELEVARSPREQAIGLMFRRSLPDNRGMLFLFESPRPAQFWMKNTLISLDMIFLQDGEIKAIQANVPPCEADPTLTFDCPIYTSNDIPVNQVIELRAGRAEELGLQVGDNVVIEFLPDASN